MARARKRKRNRFSSGLGNKPRPGVLVSPATTREQIIPLLITTAKACCILIVQVGMFVISIIYIVPALFWGVLKDTSNLLVGAYWVVICCVTWQVWKPINEIQKLIKSVPPDYLDLKYIASKYNRVLLFMALTAMLYLSPVFYINGLIGRLALIINQNVTRNKPLADSLAWFTTAALTGLIGNVATLLLYKLVGIMFRRRA